jgi:hypothetical protein
MNPVPNKNTTDEAIQEFLDKGGVIQQIPAGQRTDVDYKTSFYGKRLPKQKEETDD